MEPEDLKEMSRQFTNQLTRQK